ncbi:hypothetical protein MRB53_041335 [Persea americana]|nr:hypothetical protein MRB53_041335 [Persea americana]
MLRSEMVDGQRNEIADFVISGSDAWKLGIVSCDSSSNMLEETIVPHFAGVRSEERQWSSSAVTGRSWACACGQHNSLRRAAHGPPALVSSNGLRTRGRPSCRAC